MNLGELIAKLLEASRKSEDGLFREVVIGAASSSTELTEEEATLYRREIGQVVTPDNPYKPVTLTELLPE